MEEIDIKLKQKRNLKKYLLMRKLQGVRKNSYLMDNKEGYEDKIENKNRRKNKNKMNSEGSIIKEDQSENEYDEYLYDFENEELLQESQRRDIYDKIEAQVKPNRPTEIPQSAKIILKYWLCRSKHYKKACNLIGGVIDRNVKRYCSFCGQTWGLICQPEKNVEDLFLQYLRKINQKNVFSDKLKDGWQDFFQQNCQFRTECFTCNSIISDQFYNDYMDKKQQMASGKRESSRKASHLLVDIANPNAYMNFLYEEQPSEGETNNILKKRTQPYMENQREFQKTNTIVSLQNRPSIIQSVESDNNNKYEDVDDFDMFKKQYQIQNQTNTAQDDKNVRRYNRQLSLSRFRQTTPSQTFRDSYQEGSKSRLISIQSNSRIPFFTQQTQEINTHNQTSLIENNEQEEVTFTTDIEGKQQQNLHISNNNIQSRKQSQLLGVSGISQIKAKNFSDFEDNADEHNNSNSNDIGYKLDEDGKNQFDTDRVLVSDRDKQEQSDIDIKIKGLLKQQNTIDLNNETDEQENKQQNQYYNKSSNAPSRRRLYSEVSEDYKLISNSANQTELEINPKNIPSQSSIQQQQQHHPHQEQQRNPVVRLKLSAFCRLWKQLAQSRISKQNAIINQQLHAEDL